MLCLPYKIIASTDTQQTKGTVILFADANVSPRQKVALRRYTAALRINKILQWPLFAYDLYSKAFLVLQASHFGAESILLVIPTATIVCGHLDSSIQTCQFQCLHILGPNHTKDQYKVETSLKGLEPSMPPSSRMCNSSGNVVVVFPERTTCILHHHNVGRLIEGHFHVKLSPPRPKQLARISFETFHIPSLPTQQHRHQHDLRSTKTQ